MILAKDRRRNENVWTWDLILFLQIRQEPCTHVTYYAIILSSGNIPFYILTNSKFKEHADHFLPFSANFCVNNNDNM